MKETINWLNGKSIDQWDSSWGFNRAFLYGESVFTSALIENSKILFEEDHLHRISAQASNFFYGKKIDQKNEIKSLIKQDLENIANLNIDLARIRITIFFKDSDFEIKNLFRLITLTKINQSPKKIKAQTHKILDTQTRKFKLGNYASEFYLKRNLKNDFNDICIINDENEILELVTSNIFFITGGFAYFPEFKDDFLNGITVNHFKKALAANYKIINERIKLEQLAHFESAFACNAIKTIVPIEKIDQFNFKNSCLSEVQKLWSDYVSE